MVNGQRKTWNTLRAREPLCESRAAFLFTECTASVDTRSYFRLSMPLNRVDIKSTDQSQSTVVKGNMICVKTFMVFDNEFNYFYTLTIKSVTKRNARKSIIRQQL